MKTHLFILILLGALTANAQSYQPNWESLDSRPTPEWFQDAKFGIFVCWGLYSVPAWSPVGQYAEWYQYWLKQKSHNGQVTEFHNRTYGEDFEFKDFAPLFKAELFNPQEWAELFEKAGAKYIVFTTKHHSGYTMWPSREAENTWGINFNPTKVGPMRDLTGEICEAVRERNIKAGLYYSIYEWYHPLYKTDLPRFVSEHLHPQFKDLVSRYHPDIIWTDGEWEQSSATWRTPELLAWWFNNAPNKETLVINDRWGNDTRHKHGGFFTTEYGSGMDNDAHPWEENRGMGFSYGYNRAERLEDYRSAQELILMLVDLVSRGGNLCLDIGPASDGSIPVIMEERLLQIGEWLKANGEAIYGTRMAKEACQWSEGEKPGTKRGEYMSGFNILKETIQPDSGQAVKEIFFTQKGSTLYAITPNYPNKELIINNIEQLIPDWSPARKSKIENRKITSVQTKQSLNSEIREGRLIIRIPEIEPNFAGKAAYVFRIEF